MCQSWKGKEPRSIQKVKDDAAIMASLAIWLVQPSVVCYTGIFHAISWAVPGGEDLLPVIQQIEIQTPVFCHPKDVRNGGAVSHLTQAAKLHAVLVDVPRKNPVWEALRSCWAALTMYSADRRYPFFWMALESLFGADDAAEIGYKLAQRISFFLGDTPDARKRSIRSGPEFREAHLEYRGGPCQLT